MIKYLVIVALALMSAPWVLTIRSVASRFMRKIYTQCTQTANAWQEKAQSAKHLYFSALCPYCITYFEQGLIVLAGHNIHR